MDELFAEEIPAALAGERLDRVVSLIADISRAAAVATIAAGGVRVDGAVVSTGKGRLEVGRFVEVDSSKIPRDELPRADRSIDVRIVYDDEHIIVVDKPAGIVVHPAPGHRTGTLVNGLLALYPELSGVGEKFRPGIVHRLDQGTSGLLIVARTTDSYEKLVELLSTHEVRRVYLALVWGSLESETMTIDAPIARDPQDPLRMAVVTNGKYARTDIEEVETFVDPPMSLLRCELETGRTHQIRVHLRAIGHPVVGDAAYGGVRPHYSVARPFLHACAIEFDHPITGIRMAFDSPLPNDLEGVIDDLRHRHSS